ncbi:MAG: hypothetical protein GXY33_14370 [Phycisphaerae bacterium]|nr:hypothetical protein [Phycisphaerae bacterium]
MTPKERVAAVIGHRAADRVAIDFAARSEVVAALRDRLGAASDEALLDALGVDLRGVGPAFKGDTGELCYADPTVEVTADGVYRDIWGVGFRANRTDKGSYMDLAANPLVDVEDAKGLDRHAWPTAELWDYSGIAEQVRRADRYWVGGHSRGIFEISWFLRGFENFLMDLTAEPQFASQVMDRVQAYLFERTQRILEAGGGRIDMMEYNDDVGGQQGMLISPNVWREHLKPRMRRFAELCRGFGARVRYHSCGSIRPIIGDLIEIGVDVLNPVQPHARNMDPRDLKREFAGRITLNGGIDTEELLPRASADQVRDEVGRLIEALGRGGGYILAPSHVFQGDVPIENVLAVYEAALGRRF